jgi:hypothetical protein
MPRDRKNRFAKRSSARKKKKKKKKKKRFAFAKLNHFTRMSNKRCRLWTGMSNLHCQSCIVIFSSVSPFFVISTDQTSDIGEFDQIFARGYLYIPTRAINEMLSILHAVLTYFPYVLRPSGAFL